MKKLILILFIFYMQKSIAQNMYGIGRNTFICLNGGPSKFLGDIGGYPKTFSEKLIIDKNTFFFGLTFQRFYKRKFSFELALNEGKLSASDADISYSSTITDDYFRFRRNLDFRTNILEGSINFHLYPLQFTKLYSKVNQFPIQPFAYVGFGYYSFNPQGSYYDATYKTTVWVDLQPLHTEGQGYAEYPDRKEYQLQQVSIPYGYGITYFGGENFFISLSVNNRKLFTDYIDDVSTTYIDPNLHYKYAAYTDEADQAVLMSDKSFLIDPLAKNGVGEIRGNPKRNDAFYNYNLKVGLRIARKKSKKADFYKYDETEVCN